MYFISPADGDTVKGPVTVRFGLRGMGVAPAGTVAEGTGHHHLIVDAPLPAAGLPIPNDANHLHFGKGQTETTLDLPPGQHTLQLLRRHRLRLWFGLGVTGADQRQQAGQQRGGQGAFQRSQRAVHFTITVSVV